MPVMAMRVCILGAGGLGSLVGGMLAESGLRVTLVGRPEHVEAIRQDGLRISGISGERRIVGGLDAVESAARARGPFDALILCVKAKDTEAALRDANGLRADAGVVLSLQNTVAKDAALAEWIGRDRVVGASTTEAATLDGAGSVRHVATAPTAFYFGALGRLGAAGAGRGARPAAPATRRRATGSPPSSMRSRRPGSRRSRPTTSSTSSGRSCCRPPCWRPGPSRRWA